MPSSRPRLLGHFRVLLSADLVVRVLVFGTALVTARVLGPAGLGAVAVALAFLSYAGVLGDGGLTTLAQLAIVRGGGRDDRVVSATVALQLGLSLALALLLSGLVWLLPLSGHIRTLTLVGTPLLVAQALNLFFVLQADEQMARLAGLRVATQVVTSAVCLLGLAAGWRGPVVVGSLWVGVLLSDVLTLQALRGAGRLALTRPDRSVARTLLRGAPPYLAAMLLTQVLTNADVITLGLSRSTSDAGTYSAAYRISGSLQLVVGVLVTAVFPELIRRSNTVPRSAAPLVRRLVRLATRPGFALSAFVIVLSGPLMRLLYGHAYAASAGLLSVLILYVPLGYYNSILAQALVAAGRQAAHLQVIAVTSVVVVVALVWFVPAHGPGAAAVILLVGEGVSIVGLTLAFGRDEGPLLLSALVAQLPFLLLPWAAMAAVRHWGHADWWVTALTGAVVTGAAEAVARVHLWRELRGLPLAAR